jgi:hypothetical protein
VLLLDPAHQRAFLFYSLFAAALRRCTFQDIINGFLANVAAATCFYNGSAQPVQSPLRPV